MFVGLCYCAMCATKLGGWRTDLLQCRGPELALTTAAAVDGWGWAVAAACVAGARVGDAGCWLA